MFWGGSDPKTLATTKSAVGTIHKAEKHPRAVACSRPSISTFLTLSTNDLLVEVINPDNPNQVPEKSAGSIRNLHTNHHMHTGDSTGDNEEDWEPGWHARWGFRSNIMGSPLECCP